MKEAEFWQQVFLKSLEGFDSKMYLKNKTDQLVDVSADIADQALMKFQERFEKKTSK